MGVGRIPHGSAVMNRSLEWRHGWPAYDEWAVKGERERVENHFLIIFPNPFFSKSIASSSLISQVHPAGF
jgi:hypothetical protein